MERMTDRGQLLLAGAFVLAIALIGLTLVLTSGGYTTTLAGQDNAVDRGTDAITVREAVLSDLDRYLMRTNSKYSTYSTRQAQFNSILDPPSGGKSLSDGYRDQYGRHGRLVDLGSSATYQEGHEIELMSDGSFDRLDSDGDGEEEIVTNSRIRNVTLAFSDVPTGSSSFELRLYTGAREWLVDVSTMGGSDWVITVEEVSGSYAQSCTRPGTSPDMFVDLSAATIDGNHCTALEAITFDQKQYSVKVDGALSQTDGRIWMTVKGPGPAVTYDSVIYSANVPFRYDSPSVTYGTELRSAPGEIR